MEYFFHDVVINLIVNPNIVFSLELFSKISKLDFMFPALLVIVFYFCQNFIPNV